jgi:crotonobetainyl-CoA:carnitine CoA-transferase CaiB-like acyl-CoA transferase
VQEHVGLAIKYDAEPGRPELALAGVGAHTAEVLGELGYDDAAIAALSGDGAR